ncbi:MAG: hypothetical protein ON057_000640 [Glomeribacter sp. 1016415]|nr:hypothetical protein [Glomeribacter sp. 1016415]
MTNSIKSWLGELDSFLGCLSDKKQCNHHYCVENSEQALKLVGSE